MFNILKNYPTNKMNFYFCIDKDKALSARQAYCWYTTNVKPFYVPYLDLHLLSEYVSFNSGTFNQNNISINTVFPLFSAPHNQAFSTGSGAAAIRSAYLETFLSVGLMLERERNIYDIIRKYSLQKIIQREAIFELLLTIFLSCR